MYYYIKKNISSFFVSLGSTRLNKKIIVFESDDWGGIRTPSKKAIEIIKSKGGIVDNCPFAHFDTIENSKDIEYLAEVLHNFKDSQGNAPQITANFVTANPDFDAIFKSDFKRYYYEKFDQTYLEYYPNENVLSKIKEAYHNKLFLPQFHGREHVNVSLWLKLLREKDPVIREAFDWKFWGIKTKMLNRYSKNIQATFDIGQKNSKSYIPQALESGLDIFEEKFGFRAKSFIPNNYIWSTNYNKKLKELGVDYLQGIKRQFLPKDNMNSKRNSHPRIPGKIEPSGLISIVRNSTFEPSLYNSSRRKALELCLTDIQTAFKLNQPAVITTHRINYISSLYTENRDQNLKLMTELLTKILDIWPDVLFYNSVELGNLYNKKLNH